MNIQDFLKDILPAVIMMAAQVLDNMIDGSKLNETEQHIIQLAYAGGNTFGKDLVGKTPNINDDEALASFLSLCEDTAKEGQFQLPKLEDVK